MDALSDLIGAARAELLRENAQGALERLLPALPQYPKSTELLLAYAEVLNDLDQPADALATYRRILDLAPSHPEASAAVREAAKAKELLLGLAYKAELLRAFDEARDNYEAV